MRRLLILGVAIVVVLLAADTVLWRWAVGRVMDETALWQQARRAEGWTVAMGPPSAEGWPFAARIRMQGVELAAAPPTTPSPLAFGAAETVLGVTFWQPSLLRIDLQGPQHLRLGAGSDLAFTTSSHEIAVKLSPDRLPDQADIDIADLHLAAPPTGPLTIDRLTIHAAFPPARLPAEQTLSVTATAGPILLPPAQRLAAIGPRIERVAIEAALAAATLDVRRLDLDWGRLTLAGHAGLHLDANRQPAGSGQAKLTGLPETLDALAAAQLIAPRAAMTVKAVLGLMQQPQAAGPPMVDLPLTLENRTLQVGPVPVLKLPDIVW